MNAMLISHIFNIQLPEQVPSDTTQDIENIDNPTSDIDTIATRVISEKECNDFNIQPSVDKHLEGELSRAEEQYETLTIGEVDIEYVSNDASFLYSKTCLKQPLK